MSCHGITAVVLHFRTPRQTLDCLRSLFAEGVRTVVLVDNSEDDGASLVEMSKDLDGLCEAGLYVEILGSNRNHGFAKGVNIGLVQALRDDVRAVLLINSDARLEPGALSRLMLGLDNAGVCVPRMRSIRHQVSASLFGFYQAVTAMLTRNEHFGCTRYPVGCCLLLRADIARPPLFDEDFFFYGEDVMLGRRFAVNKVRVKECPEALIVHEGSGSAKIGSMFYEYHINRGHWLLARKLAPSSLKYGGYIACRCVTLPVRALIRSARFRSLIPLRGLLAASMDVLCGRFRSFTPPLTHAARPSRTK